MQGHMDDIKRPDTPRTVHTRLGRSKTGLNSESAKVVQTPKFSFSDEFLSPKESSRGKSDTSGGKSDTSGSEGL